VAFDFVAGRQQHLNEVEPFSPHGLAFFTIHTVLDVRSVVEVPRGLRLRGVDRESRKKWIDAGWVSVAKEPEKRATTKAAPPKRTR
jgi:hypothetical protein